MKYRALVPAVLLACALPVAGRTQIPQDLRTAMQLRLDAVWKKDGATWSRLTADEFTVVVPEGRLQTKADRLAALKREKPEPPHEIRQEQVRVYGDTAVRRFVDGSEWVLEVWVRQNAAWHVVAAQVNFVKP
jgi:predicted signal transduction protein with EAL and GGDEF domain